MHSCEVAVAPPPPIQGTALLLELGTLIIEGRSSHLTKGAPTPRTPESRSNTTASYKRATASFNNGQEGHNGDHCGPGLDDVHSRVLAAKLLNVKNYQKAQFKKDGGEGEKPMPTTSVSPCRDLHAVRSQQTVLQGQAEALWKEQVPLCIEVLLAPSCGACLGPLMLLERWTMSIYCKGSNPPNHITSQWLLNAVRSQLHFSQISAWSAKLHEEQKVVSEDSPTERQRKLSRETCNYKKYESNCDEEELLAQEGKEKKKKKLNVVYNIKIPGDDYRIIDFRSEPVKHTFPITDIGSNVFLMVLLESLPRLDEIPIVQCICSSNSSSTLKRRRSKDVAHASDEVLAHTLASVCSLNENCGNTSKSHHKEGENSLADDLKRRLKANALSSEVGAINPDKGCSSGISRKLSVYSNPGNSDMLYSTQASRGSTPDNSDYKAFALPCTSASCTDNSLYKACQKTAKQMDCSYQLHVEDSKVPSDKVVETNFLLVDDRMQTPCGKKGKHRCNCDDESDHGSHLKDSSDYGDAKPCDDSERRGSRLLETCKSLDGRRTKEIAKYLRRLRKEAKFKQMRDSGQSSQENSECKSDEMPKEKFKSASKCTRSRHNDLSIKERIQHKGVYVDEEPDDELYQKYVSTRRNPVPEVQTSSNDGSSTLRLHRMMGGNLKAADPLPATSIPILQASRFDHAMRFGNYRTSVPFHGSLSSKDIYPAKELECACSSVGCDQMASIKTCKQSNSNPLADHNFNIKTQDLDIKSSCRTFPTSCDFCNSDDNYRPVVKKMISSCTQTDDFKCDCGKSLVPKCFECSNNVGTEIESYHSGMKRSRGSHDLAGVDKSALLLEAIERPSRISESQKDDTDTGIDAIIYCDSDATNKDKCSNNVQVIENKCDNSFSDKSKLYVSCNSSNTDYRSTCTSNSESGQHCNDEDIICVQPMKQTSEKNSFVKFPFADNFDKAINFIRRPRLRRFMPIVGKLDKVVMERNEEKKRDLFNTISPSSNFIKFSFEKPINDSLYSSKGNEESVASREACITTDTSSRDEEKHIVVYEKGSYGSIMNGCMETKHGEKHSFDENETSCKHFRRDNESHLTSGEIHDNPCTSQCPDNDVHKNVKNSSLNIQLDHSTVPSVSEMDKFRWRLDSAASMVFHSGTGLPLTSSPAPLRRGKSSFDYDSSINSVSGIKSALYGASISDLESEPCNSSWSPGSSPGSPLHWEPPSPPLLTDSLNLKTTIVEKDSFTYSAAPYTNIISVTPKSFSSKQNKFRHGTSSGLLGSFEESVLNGRLEPAATVAGFTAEIGASGSFCPQHLKLPVTVFFYSLGDNTTSAPYLGHINLGRRGYNVPRAGTIQVTLFNPHGTVVKMFVVMYDMADMPPNSKTFLRQKTLCVPAVCSVQPSKQDPRALRYLIHLRFLASKSGKVYLHTDVRIIVSRKADMDTAHSLRPTISHGYQQNDKEEVKRKSVETGTFSRRTCKDLKKSSYDTSSNEGVCTTLYHKKMNQSNNFVLSSFLNEEVDIINDKQNNNDVKNRNMYGDREVETSLDNDLMDGRIRRRSDSMDGLPKELSYELRSYTYGPDNPKYSPR